MSNTFMASMSRHQRQLKRFGACIIASVVLAAMWSPVEGSSTDFYYELKKTERFPRLLVFLAIGVVAYLVITFWSRVKPYVTRPGVVPGFLGLIVALCGYVFMNWYDNVGSGKFNAVSKAVSHTNGLPWLTKEYFGWLHWALLVGALVLCAVAVVLEIRRIAWGGAALAAIGAFATYRGHQDVADRAGGIDHSLGWVVTIIGYVIIVGAACAIALSRIEIASTRAFVNRALGWRPGLPVVAVALIVGVVAFMAGRWFAPGDARYNTKFSGMHDVFAPTDLAGYAKQYFDWLAWVLFAISVVVAATAAYLRHRAASWAAAAIGLASCAFTIVVMYKYSSLAAHLAPTEGTTWNNLGTGPWLAAAAFLMVGGAGFIAATAGRGSRPTAADAGTFLVAPGAARSAIIVALAFALFFPPTMTGFWQQVLVTEIGPYLLLAVGLNVVVGWAGLLDLGYIAFFAVGCYFTAYLTGSLPIKPPSWMILPSLAAIPVAIAACAAAGFILGAPTLRLRGDYLAIVTLGFGEIIQLAANNADGITNGSRGTGVDPIHHVKNVPHPAIHIGPLNITWGENQLQYWYLLFIYLVLLVLAFRGLEHSRIGRAWAAIREDEVAAEASGVNTFRIKLLAFAIGASSSGVAGVFYGSQVGFFSPTDFTLIYSILVVAYVVFGGMGSLVGALAGAAALTWLPRFLQDQVPPADKQMWIGAIVVLMMIFRPSGLIPAKRRRIEMEGLDEVPVAEPVAVASAGSLGATP
jgi:ABC-type branched-subunit amino acid transport system permease subunit